MSSKLSIMLVLLIFMCQGVSASSEQENIEMFSNNLTEITKLIVDFQHEIHSTRLGDIVEIRKKIPESYKNKTVGDLALAYDGLPFLSLSTSQLQISSGLKSWFAEKYSIFYKKIYPLVLGYAKSVKHLPLRPSSFTISTDPFGIGANVDIEINYDSEFLK